jgi:hypothetical protein
MRMVIANGVSEGAHVRGPCGHAVCMYTQYECVHGSIHTAGDIRAYTRVFVCASS